MKKVTFFASLGSALEYFDFVIYAMLSGYLATVFFSSADTSQRLIQIFSTFAVGYFARPLGGLVFGMLADVIGRKSIFLLVMIIMACATFGIGLLPTYEHIGLWAAFFLILFRFIQGLSFGAELPGAITVISEFSSTSERCKNCSMVISSTCLGSIAASFILFVMTKYMSEKNIIQFGWRLPFLLGGIFGLICFILRKFLTETPSFTKTHTHLKAPLLAILRDHKYTVLLGIGSMLFPSSLIILNLYFPAYISQYAIYSSSQIYLAMTIGLIWCAFTIPLFGWLSDKIEIKRMFYLASLTFIFINNTLLQYLFFNHLIIFMIVYQTFIAATMSSFFPFLTRLFPPSSRYTGVSLCYNVSYCLSSLLPLGISCLLKISNNLSLVFWVLSATCLIGILCSSAPLLRYKHVNQI